MKILLVYPEYPVTFWSFKYALQFVHKKSNLPPLGVLTIAAMLPKEWDLKLVDMNTDKLTDLDIQWADYVFISAMNIQKKSACSVIQRCRDFHVKTVGGGPLFTSEPESFDQVDHLLLYEGEVCIPQFLRDLELGCPKRLYEQEDYPSLEQTPVPAWHLIDLRKYAMLSMQYSRGCPFHCEFCNVVSLFGHVPRTKTAAQIIDELEAIYRMKWRGSIFFVDDNFIGNKNKLKKEILPVLIDWMKAHDYPFAFFTEASINMADDEELMELMVDAGFDNVFIGIETVDDDSLKECNKVQNTRRNLIENVRAIQRHGMQVQGGFILGFDNDKPSIFSRMEKFIQESGIVTAMVGLLNAPRGTGLYERMERENRLFTDFSGVNTDINFLPRMNLKDLKKGYYNVVESIYSPRNYYKRVRVFLENYKPVKRHKRGFHFSDIGAFLRACFKLGIQPKERMEFWKLLVWSLKKKTKVFSMAITFSIYGYHFRKCHSEMVAASAE